MDDEIRRRQYEHVKRMRQLIAEEKLVLFVGEGLSALGAASSIDDWWKLVENFEARQSQARAGKKIDVSLHSRAKSVCSRRRKTLRQGKAKHEPEKN